MAQAVLKPCAICQKPSTERFRPFCSKRCADEDLGRWFTESYRLPTNETVESDERVPDSDDY